MSIGRPKIRGVEVDKDLANAVFLDDMLEQLALELSSQAMSFRALVAMIAMFIPGMVGTLLTMFANLQIAMLTYFGNYQMGEMMLWTVAFYLGVILGPMMSILVYGLITLWALRSFQGYIVIRLTARNPSGSKVAMLDYIGEMPKPMRKPRIDEIGESFSAFMKAEITKLHTGIPLAEVQANIQRMQDRFAEAYQRQLEVFKGANVKTVTRKLLVVKQTKEGTPVLRDDGTPETEEVSVRVPVYKPKRSRRYRLAWMAVLLFVVFASILSLHFVLFNMFGFNLLKFMFGWLPIWG